MTALLLASRVPLLLVGLLATFLLASGDAAQPGNLLYIREAPRWLQAWVHWDAQWYLLLADRGYTALEEEPGLAPRNAPSDTAGFFPLYPGLVGLLRRALPFPGGAALAGLLVSNAALAAYLVLLARWTEARAGEPAGRWACIAVLAFPTTIFLSVPYSESLFLALAVGAVEASRASRGGLAALLGTAAAMTRPVGVFLAVPLALPASAEAGRTGPLPRRLLPALGPLVGLGIHAMICWATFGEPLAFVARQSRWRGQMGPPWRFVTEFLADPRAHGPAGSVVDMVVAVAFLAALPAVWRRLGAGAALYSAAALLLPLSTGLFSFSRLALAAFPVFAWAGMWCAEAPLARRAYPAAALPFAGFFTALYAAGWWVG